MQRGSCKQGVFVKNQINGTEGLVTGKIIWMFGCEKLIVIPKDINEKSFLFDSSQFRHIVSEEFLELTEESSPFEREFEQPATEKWFGKKCRDKVTGLEGICIACTTSLFSSDQYLLERLNKKSIPVNEWFDEGRLEIIGAGITAEEVSSSRPGGTNTSLPVISIPAIV